MTAGMAGSWHLLCDRDGMILVSDTEIPGLLPLAVLPTSMLDVLAGIADKGQTNGIGHFLVPGVAEAGDDADAALDAVVEFQKRLCAAVAVFGRTVH